MIYVILLQATGDIPFNPQWILFGAIGLIFYFFMIRPQQKKQKDQKKFLEEIKKGDQIVTIGGLHGKVTSVEDKLVTIDVDKGVKLTFDKTSISLDSSKLVNESK